MLQAINFKNFNRAHTTATPKKRKNVSAIAALFLAICTILLLSHERVYAASSNGLSTPTEVNGVTYQYKIVTTNISTGAIHVVVFNDTAKTCIAASCTQGFIGSSTPPFLGTGFVDFPPAVFIHGINGSQGVDDALSYDCSNFDYNNCTFPSAGNSGSSAGQHAAYYYDGYLLNMSSFPIYDWYGNGANNYGSFSSTTGGFVVPFQQFLSATVGTSTLLSTSNFLSFLNIPYLIQTKVPFGYFFEAKEAITEGLSTTSVRATPSIGLSFKLTRNAATTTVILFSSTTIRMFMEDSTISYLRGILVTILYAEFIYFMYHLVRKIKL